MIRAAELVSFNFERLNPNTDDQHRYIRHIASFILKVFEKKNMDLLLSPNFNSIGLLKQVALLLMLIFASVDNN